MKINHSKATSAQLLDPNSDAWRQAVSREFAMIPTPLKGNPMIKHVSPFIEKSTDHGTVSQLVAAGLHNGQVLALRLSWKSEKHDAIVDLDEFVDGVAVMFPLSAQASAVTMGAKGHPVNAWYWKADQDGVAFDVVAEGYGTSMRRKGADSQVKAGAVHKHGAWHVVLARPLDIGASHARFRPGEPTRVAFGVWDGGNRERAGRKSFSGDFVLAELQK